VHETRRTRLARASKKDNAERRAERARDATHTLPDPVLGHAPGDDSKWLNSDLAKVLVSQSELQSPSALAPPLDIMQPLQPPDSLQWGIAGDPQARRFLLESLPDVSSQRALKNMDVVNPRDAYVQKRALEGQWNEMCNAHMITRLMDLRNASAGGIAFENRRRCVEAFSTAGKPNDTGRPEVQGASSLPCVFRHMLMECVL
jgi:small subunit ribosomal protein S15